MNMRTHFEIDTTSFTNSFLLLVMFAGVLNIDLFERDAISDYHNHKVLYRIELVLNAETSDARSPRVSIAEDLPWNDDVKDRILPLHFHPTCFGNALFFIQSTGHFNTRPFYSSHNPTRLFNIPHQNSDEEETFIFQSM